MGIIGRRKRKREEQEKKQFAATGVAVKEMQMEEKWHLSRYALNGLIAFMGAYGTLTCYLTAFFVSYRQAQLFCVLLAVSIYTAIQGIGRGYRICRYHLFHLYWHIYGITFKYYNYRIHEYWGCPGIDIPHCTAGDAL